MKNLAGLMKQASQMEQRMADSQTALEAASVEGGAGAGMVRVIMNGKGELRAIEIDPKLADPTEIEMLQDLLLAAHADAKRKTEAVAAEEMKKATGGLELPPGLKLPFLRARAERGVRRGVGRPESDPAIGVRCPVRRAA